MDLLCMVGIGFCFVLLLFIESLCAVRYYSDHRIIHH